MRILVYGVGKTGSLIAYELLKEGYEIYVMDLDFRKAEKLAWDLRTIRWNIRDIWFDTIQRYNFDIVVVASNRVNFNELDKISAAFFYIFSNVDDEIYERMKKDRRFVMCGDTVNREREFLFFGERTLKGDHWREEPEERREELYKYFAKNISPWHYGAVYYALQEIKALINVFKIDNDGSIDVAFPK